MQVELYKLVVKLKEIYWSNSPGVASIGSHIGLASLNLKAIDEAGVGRRRSGHILSFGPFFREAGHLSARDCSIFTAAARITSVSRKERLARAVCVAIVTVTGAAWLACLPSTGGFSGISACAGLIKEKKTKSKNDIII